MDEADLAVPAELPSAEREEIRSIHEALHRIAQEVIQDAGGYTAVISSQPKIVF